MSSSKRQRLDLGGEAGPALKKQQFVAGSAAAASASSSGVNPMTGRPFSDNYWKIFETRKTLPVYAQRKEFSDMLASTQCMILVGETGSGSVDADAASAGAWPGGEGSGDGVGHGRAQRSQWSVECAATRARLQPAYALCAGLRAAHSTVAAPQASLSSPPPHR